MSTIASVAPNKMERYWNQRAREDAFHYVDSRQTLGSPDQTAFWQAGDEVLDRLLGSLGLELAGAEDVVEIGCGIGRITRTLARRARSVEALDISEEMLERARLYNPHLENVRWLHGDGRTLAPLQDSAIDACISFVVFQHLPDPELTYAYVREMARVLRPGGWAAFQVSNLPPSIHEPPPGLRRLRMTISQRRYQHPAWLGSAVELPRLRSVAGEAGLEIESVEGEGSRYCLIGARRS